MEAVNGGIVRLKSKQCAHVVEIDCKHYWSVPEPVFNWGSFADGAPYSTYEILYFSWKCDSRSEKNETIIFALDVLYAKKALPPRTRNICRRIMYEAPLKGDQEANKW